MSAAPERRALLDELASRGVRITAQRRALVEVIQSSKKRLDAVTLLEQARLKAPNIDRATVYRTLDLLKKLRLIDELELMHLYGERHYYEASTEYDRVLHLTCFRCGRIEELASPMFERLKSEILKQTGFSIRVTRLELGGNCRACGASEHLTHEEAGNTATH